MRLTAIYVVSCLLAASVSGEENKLPELKVPKLSKAPKIDGSLDDEAWKEAAQSDAFRLEQGGKPQSKTRVLIGQDDNNLYVAVECSEDVKQLKSLKADVTEHDGDGIWDDDDVELFIDPTGSRKYDYYQFIVNSKGVTFDVFVSGGPQDLDKTWEPKYEVKTKAGAESWVAEFAIPWTAFNRTEKSVADWTFNVARNRSGGDSEGIYWSPVFATSSHTPEKFGKLLGMPVKALKTK